MSTFTDDMKAAALSFALGFFEMVRNVEIPKSARFTKLDNAMDNCMKAIALYSWGGWQGGKIRLVHQLIDKTNKDIRMLFGSRRRWHQIARQTHRERWRVPRHRRTA